VTTMDDGFVSGPASWPDAWAGRRGAAGPLQPMFGDLREDGLIAHTFVEYKCVTRKSRALVSPDCPLRPAIGFRFAWFGGPVPGSPRREPRECGAVSGEATRIPSACASGFPAAAMEWPHRQQRRFSGAESIGHDFTACWLGR
jgi:hypothetical protein